MKKLLQVLAISGVMASALVGNVMAAGSASFSLSPAGGSYNVGNSFGVTVYENGTDVNVVTAKLTYDAAKLSCVGVGNSSAFPNTISATCNGGSVTISRYAAPGTAVSGAQAVGSISFVATAPGTAAVSFAAGSQIASNGTDTWNGSTTGGSYSISPAPVASGTTTPGSGGSSSAAATKKTVAASTTSVGAATTQTDNTEAAKNTSDGKVAAVSISTDKKAVAVSEKSSNPLPWILGGIVVLAAAAAAVWYFLNNRHKKSAVPATASASAVKTKTIAKKTSKK